MTRLLILVLALTLAGCGTIASRLLPHSDSGAPISMTSGLLPSFSCKGKGTISINAAALGSASGTLLVDCPDGLILKQLQPGAPDAPNK